MADMLSNDTRSERVTERWRRRFLPRTEPHDDVRFFDLLVGSLLHNPSVLAMLATATVILGMFVQQAAYDSRPMHPRIINPSVLNLENQHRH